MSEPFLLHNGLPRPAIWPPELVETSMDEPLPAPWRDSPPELIDIRTGRQLFVDDFLIERTDLARSFHDPEPAGDGPVFQPETDIEMNGGYCPLAAPFKDGLFYDENAGRYKLWYHAGWFDGTAYAESEDGIRWTRLAELGGPKDSVVVRRKPNQLRDGASVWIDYDAKRPDERFKMMVFYREFAGPIDYFHDMAKAKVVDEYALLYKSADGIHWDEVRRTGPCGDNTSFFYNPFTKKWCFSIRTHSALSNRYVRTRGYCEADDFFAGAGWTPDDVKFWGRIDMNDRADPRMEYAPQLYNLDATPYESLLLGMHGAFLGPPNSICAQIHRPKIIDMKLSFSRDGFHWDRAGNRTFLGSSRVEGSWNYGYLHPVGGLCCVGPDRLSFYYTAFSGRSPVFGMHMYAGGSMGLATLRRDGFASLQPEGGHGELLTRPLRFEGGALYVNADAAGGSLRAELLDAEGHPLPGFSADACAPMQADSTKCKIRFAGDPDLSARAGQPIRIRFLLDHAQLYSFWISPKPSGASMGYLAAGGPGLKNAADRE